MSRTPWHGFGHHGTLACSLDPTPLQVKSLPWSTSLWPKRPSSDNPSALTPRSQCGPGSSELCSGRVHGCVLGFAKFLPGSPASILAMLRLCLEPSPEEAFGKASLSVAEQRSHHPARIPRCPSDQSRRVVCSTQATQPQTHPEIVLLSRAFRTCKMIRTQDSTYVGFIHDLHIMGMH